MKNHKIVTINGKSYDGSTGLPIDRPAPKPAPKTIQKSQSLAQKSQAIKARAAKLPEAVKKDSVRRPGRNMDIARSKSISRFAPPTPIKSKSATVKPSATGKVMDTGVRKHPIAARIEKKQITAKPVAETKTNKVIKEEAITTALNAAREKDNEKTKFFQRRPQFLNMFTVGIFLIVTAGYLTYVNMPALSVRIASAQAGIAASFPDYYPDGYRIDGPVTYSDGEVIIRFKANTGDSKFIIKQSKSSWDSSAVKNQVNEESLGEFATREKNGQTIFTYGNNATWVNGGILYTISGNTRLSTDQVLRIATSL